MHIAKASDGDTAERFRLTDFGILSNNIFPSNGRKHIAMIWFNLNIFLKCGWKKRTGFSGDQDRKVTETQRTLTEERWD